MSFKKKFLFCLGVFIFCPLFVNADVIVNDNGVEFSEEEYSYLLQFYKEPVLDKMTEEQYEYEMEHIFSKVSDNEIYVEEKTYYDENGNVESVITSEITEEEYNSDVSMPMSTNANGYCGSTYSPQSCWQSNYQKITLTAYLQGINYYRLTLNNEWKSIPSVKSFDVLGIMWNNGSFNLANIQAYQYFNSGNGLESVNYSYPDGTNTVYKTNGNYQGAANAQNIVNSVVSDLENTLILDGTLTGTFKFWGSYQHSIAPSSMLQHALDFTFGLGGYGNVFNFGQYAIINYENLPGVTLGN